MRQTIGPLPLLGGLQLQPAEGKPTGLLRALNMEARDGLCQPRRGTSLRVAVARPTASLTTTKEPADWTAQTVVGLGITATDVQPFVGRPIFIGFLSAAGAVADEGLTFEFFGEDSAWHTLYVEKIGSMRDGNIASSSASAAVQYLSFYIPAGWKNAQPAGFSSTACWIRITKTTAWPNDLATTVVQKGNRDLAANLPARLVQANCRGVNRLFFALATRDDAAGTSAWAVGHTALAESFAGVIAATGIAAASGGSPAMPTPPPLLYVADTNELLIGLETGYFTADQGSGTGATIAGLVIQPPDERYADIATEASLPILPTCGAIFGKRVFLAGFELDPQLIEWSAPGAFWKTWPSSNLARVSSGRVLAMIPIDETLYIFTDRAIWRLALGDPTAGNESNAFLDLVEETGCASAASVVAAGKAVVFLADDGVRIFNGSRSKPLTDDVRDLFRSDSEHPFACLRKETACGAWHPVENKYHLEYSSPGSDCNDVELRIALTDNTCWLVGDEIPSAVETGVITPSLGVIGQRRRAIRAQGICYDRVSQRLVGVDNNGTIFDIDSGADDLGHPIAWYAESQNLRIGGVERSVLSEVSVVAQRETFAQMKVSVIPDGDRARADSRTITIEPDRLDTTATIGGASLAGNITPLQLDASFAPIRARFRKAARNHRIRVESVSPHVPLKILAISGVITTDDRGR